MSNLYPSLDFEILLQPKTALFLNKYTRSTVSSLLNLSKRMALYIKPQADKLKSLIGDVLYPLYIIIHQDSVAQRLVNFNLNSS